MVLMFYCCVMVREFTANVMLSPDDNVRAADSNPPRITPAALLATLSHSRKPLIVAGVFAVPKLAVEAFVAVAEPPATAVAAAIIMVCRLNPLPVATSDAATEVGDPKDRPNASAVDRVGVAPFTRNQSSVFFW
jgi:hypothetical protein